MKKLIITLLGIALIGMFVGCGKSSDTPLPLDSVGLDSVSTTESSDAATAPLTYNAKISWSATTISDDNKANAALTGIRVYASAGGETVVTEDLEATATEYTFTGLEPGETYYLHARPVYKEGTYEELGDEDSEVYFVGGPWLSSDVTVNGALGRDTLSVGSFNNADAKPTGTYSLTDFYYWNPQYNPDYTFAAADDEVWIIVEVHEANADNDTADQRNNVNWLTDDVSLLDVNTSGLDSYDDMADVDLEFYDVSNNKLFELKGTDVDGTIEATNFQTLLDSVNSGYYDDKGGCFFIRAICKTMPASFSDNNTDQKGWWGLAIYGPKVSRDTY